jgi:AcrR family transcriptional regulator
VSGRVGDTRQRIKDEAMRLFVEHGVSNVSVRDIAIAVGMKAPNLYAHFRSREDMVHELFAEGYKAYAARLRHAADSSPYFSGQLEAMVRLLCALHDEDMIRFRFLLIGETGRLARCERDPSHNPVDAIEDVIAAAMHRGELRRGDPSVLAAMILGVVTETAIFILHGRILSGMESLANDLVVACKDLARLAPACADC